MAAAVACEVFQGRIAVGERYRNEGGQWRQRTASDPVEVPSFCPTNAMMSRGAAVALAPRGAATHIPSMKVFLLTLSLGGILAVVMFGVLTEWDASAMSIHGWIALRPRHVSLAGLGGGLMALVFHSARKGYDDRIEVDTRRHPTDPYGQAEHNVLDLITKCASGL